MAELDDAARHVLNVKYDMGCLTIPTAIWGRKIQTRGHQRRKPSAP